MFKIDKISRFLSRHNHKILWLMIIVYFVTFSFISIWKYYNFGYNGLDLAIINQAFYNSAQGNLYQSSIHEPSYLGDHLALGMILLLPFYFLYQEPPLLLIIQALILALCAWPLFLIAKKVLAGNWPLFIALAWLLNPFVQNVNIFEYHNLPLAVFFILWTFYFYQEKNFPAFVVFSLLSLLVREDIPLVIVMFTVLALIHKRSLKWILWPAISSIIWFLAATAIISSITPTGQYKFLYYYSWLGNSWSEITTMIITQPWQIIYRLFSLNNLLFILALLLPFTFIILQEEFLLLGLLIFLQLAMGGANNSIIVLKTHYASLLLPAMFIAYIYSLANLLSPYAVKLSLVKKFLVKEKLLLILVLLATIIYSSLALGPLPAAVNKMAKPIYTNEVKQLKTAFYQSLPKKVSVATTYEFLTNLSSRPYVYSLHYAYIGKKQFSELDYTLATTTQTLLVDFDDAITYVVQIPDNSLWGKYYSTSDDNFRKLISQGNFQVTKIIDTLVKMEKNAPEKIKLYQSAPHFTDIEFPQTIDFDNGLTFLGWSSNKTAELNKINNLSPVLLPVSLYFKVKEKTELDYQLNLLIKNKNGEILHQKYYALAYGLYPTAEWQPNEEIKINYWFLIPKKLAQANYGVELQIVWLDGFLVLDGLKTAVHSFTKEEIFEPAIKLIPPSNLNQL